MCALFSGRRRFRRPIGRPPLGSPQIYGQKHASLLKSINLVTCHDGFTLNDLVSYNPKHNETNGEANHDGANDNRSNNFGVESPNR